MRRSLHNSNRDWRQTSGTGAALNGLNFMKKLSILLMAAGVFLMAGTAFSVSDASIGVPSDREVEDQIPLNPKHVAAIDKVAVYLKKMGREDLASSLPADFAKRKIHVTKLPMGVNAEVEPGFPTNRLAISDETIQQLYLDDGRALSTWALTFVHEDVHMKQPAPKGDPEHETPAWATGLKENGLWIRNTLDKINQVDRNTTLSPEERGERLQELNAQLADQYNDFQSTLNDIRGMTADGELYRDNKWQGVPPVGSIEAKGTTDLEAIGKYAELQVQAGQQIAMPYVKISPRPGTAKVGDKIKLETKLFNVPALDKVHYQWKVSFNGSEIATSAVERLSYTIDKPGQWKMYISVHAKGKNNRIIVIKGSQSFLEDSIIVNVEAAQPYVKISPRPGTAKVGNKIQLVAKLYDMPKDLTQAPRYNWTISRDNEEVAWPTEENLSYVVDKPGQWTMRIIVQARDKNRSLIKGKAGDDGLEDTITISVIPKVTVAVSPTTWGGSVKDVVCDRKYHLSYTISGPNLKLRNSESNHHAYAGKVPGAGGTLTISGKAWADPPPKIHPSYPVKVRASIKVDEYTVKEIIKKFEYIAVTEGEILNKSFSLSVTIPPNANSVTAEMSVYQWLGMYGTWEANVDLGLNR